MIKRILVPLDGSEASEKALAYAADLAKFSSATITMLTVVLRFQSSLPRVEQLEAHSKKLALDYLRPVQERLRGQGIDSDVLVECGQPADVIAEVAKRQQADLIVMSTHGAGSSGKYAMGSVALKVLQVAPCPVTMVRIGQAA